MQRILRILPLFLLILSFAAAASAMQSEPQTTPAQTTEKQSVGGELVKVDAANQTLTVKQENGEEVQFQYDSNTKVEGSQNGVQGLSSETGARVTVQYAEGSGKRMATVIEINKSDK